MYRGQICNLELQCVVPVVFHFLFCFGCPTIQPTKPFLQKMFGSFLWFLQLWGWEESSPRGFRIFPIFLELILEVWTLSWKFGSYLGSLDLILEVWILSWKFGSYLGRAFKTQHLWLKIGILYDHGSAQRRGSEQRQTLLALLCGGRAVLCDIFGIEASSEEIFVLDVKTKWRGKN